MLNLLPEEELQALKKYILMHKMHIEIVRINYNDEIMLHIYVYQAGKTRLVDSFDFDKNSYHNLEDKRIIKDSEQLQIELKDKFGVDVDIEIIIYHDAFDGFEKKY